MRNYNIIFLFTLLHLDSQITIKSSIFEYRLVPDTNRPSITPIYKLSESVPSHPYVLFQVMFRDGRCDSNFYTETSYAPLAYLGPFSTEIPDLYNRWVPVYGAGRENSNLNVSRISVANCLLLTQSTST